MTVGDTDRRERGQLESQVLAVLADANQPLMPRAVVEALGDDLAYTTVMTTLARLHDKGALTRQRSGRAFAYSLAGDRQVVDAAVTATRMRKALEAGSNRNVALSRFVCGLGPEDELLLTELLAGLDRDRRQGAAD